MSGCVRGEEVAAAVRAGHWPQGCAEELRAHVAGCARCGEEARLLTMFGSAREGAMRAATPQSAELVWWKAQIRRRQRMMEQLERPGLTISTATIGASVAVLLGVLAMLWPRLTASFASTGWNVWLLAAAAGVLCVSAVAALVAGAPEGRR